MAEVLREGATWTCGLFLGAWSTHTWEPGEGSTGHRQVKACDLK